MKNSLLFDFTVDKSKKTVFVTKEFDAPISMVWDAFTKPELLDQWWAPEPYLARTKNMEFSVGGKRFFAMVSPDGKESWILQKYTVISPKTNFKYWNSFSDKDENADPVGSDWDYHFSEQNGTTKVNIAIYNESPERMEKQLSFGFQQGFTVCLEQLEEKMSSWKNQIPE